MGTVRHIGKGPAGFPFSAITVANGLFYLSGSVASDIDPESGGGCAAQMAKLLPEIDEKLKGAGFAMRQAVKVTIFVTDIALVDTVTEAFTRHYGDAIDAAVSIIAVKALPNPHAVVEIEIHGVVG